MASSFPLKKNTAVRIVFPILDADGDPVTGAADLDSEYSLDGGAFSDCDNEATEIGSSGIYYLDLAAGNTNGDVVCIQVKTSTSGAKTTVLVFYTAAQTLDELDAIADAIKAKTDNLPADPADDSDIDAQLVAIKAEVEGLAGAAMRGTDSAATEAKQDIIDTNVDTLITRIPAEVAQKQHLVNGTGDITPPTNKGIWDVLGDGTNLKTLIDTVDAVVDAIKAVTDNLPDSGALTTINNYVDLIDDATNGLAAIKAEVEGLGGAAMRGTDNAALATALATVDAVVDAIKAITDNLPNSGALSDLGTILTAIQHATYGLSAIETLVDELETRLTAARAANLDELGATNIPADIDTLLTRLSALRAGYLDNLSAGAVALEVTLTAIKGIGWTNETLKAIKELVDELESGVKPIPKANFSV